MRFLWVPISYDLGKYIIYCEFLKFQLVMTLLDGSSSVDASGMEKPRPWTAELAIGQNVKELDNSRTFKFIIDSAKSELGRWRYELTRLAL